ncbi:thioredoxin [archaeon]|nr:thioredoxin [archaeon]
MIKEEDRSSRLTSKNTEISQIRIDTIESVLGEEDRSLFIAVLRKDRDLLGIIRQLEDIAAAFEKQEVLVYYTLDDLLPYFMNRFGIGGTPTFLMISSGVIAGTMLGRNDTQAIIHFINQNLACYRKDPGAAKPQHIRRSGKRETGKR